MNRRLNRLSRELGLAPGLPPFYVESEQICRRVRDTLAARPRERKLYMRQKIRFGLILAAAVLALGGTALALAQNMDALTAFFKGDAAQMESLVGRETYSISDERYTLTVESSVSDRNSAYLVLRIDAKTAAAKTVLMADDFWDMDTFNIHPLAPEAGADSKLTLEPAGGGVGVGMRELKEARTENSRTWGAYHPLTGERATHIYVRLSRMEQGLALEIPLVPVEAVTVTINAEGEGRDESYTPTGGALTVEEIILSPLTCQVKAARPEGSPWAEAPLLFFRMTDGTLRTSSQMLEWDMLGHYNADLAPNWLYKFFAVQDLSKIESVIVFDRAYPLDGGPSAPAEPDPKLLPFPLDIPSVRVDSAIGGGYPFFLRALCDGLGASCVWDNSAKTATCTYRGVTLVFTLGSQTMLVNGEPAQLRAAPAVEGGRLTVIQDPFPQHWGISNSAVYNAERTRPVRYIITP